MQRVVLVLLERPARAASLLEAAGRLAELAGGRVAALVARTPPEATILPSEEVLTWQQAALIRASEQARAEELQAAFEVWRAEAPGGADASWHDTEAVAAAALRAWGDRADAIVLPRPDQPDRNAAQHEVLAALFGTDRPVLIVPPGQAAPFGRRVAVAWRNDRHATRAVLSALRCRLAPERLFVIAGIAAGAPAPALPEILVEHGISAELHVLTLGTGVFGERMLATAHALGADMLVMGAFKHSLLRERVMGGVTRFMLGHADLPVLMRH